jgi:hypothetical protein
MNVMERWNIEVLGFEFHIAVAWFSRLLEKRSEKAPVFFSLG